MSSLVPSEHQSPRPRSYQILLTFILILILHPTVLSRHISPGLDNSWMIGLQVAYMNSLTFGSEIIFTYGPLSFLVTKMPIAVSVIVFVVFDLFVLVNLIRIILKISKSLNALATTFMLICLCFCNDIFSWDIVPAIHVIVGYYLVTNLVSVNRGEVVIAAFMCAVNFFIKANFGLFTSLTFLIFVGFHLIYNVQHRRFFIIVAGGFMCFILLACAVLTVNLFAYLSASFQIISGYPFASTIELAPSYVNFLYVSIVLMVLMLVAILVVVIHHLRTNGFKRANLVSREFAQIVFISFFIGSTTYILFKQSFIRADLGHIPTFFIFIIPVAGFLLFFESPLSRARQVSLLLACWILVVLNVQTVYSATVIDSMAYRLNAIGNYYVNLIQGEWKVENPLVMPEGLAKMIGSHDVDVIPTEASVAYFNKLQYNPRPAFQSYVTFTNKLDLVNASHYKESGPEFILLSPSAIDGRYFMWDEPATKFALLENYDFLSYERPYFVLQRRKKARQFQIAKTVTDTVKIGASIKIDSGFFQRSRITISPSLKGKIKSFFYQPAPLLVTFKLRDGSTITHRALHKLLPGGVITNYYAHIKEDVRDLVGFLASKGLPHFSNVDRITFHCDDSTFFEQTMIIETDYFTTDRDNILTTVETIADSASVKPIKYYIDQYEERGTFVTLTGWAFLPNVNTDRYRVSVMLSNSAENLLATAVRVPREDITRVFGQQTYNYDQSGFQVFLDKGLLTHSNNKVFIVLHDASGNVLATTPTGIEILTLEKEEFMAAMTLFNVDEQRVEGDSLIIRGWAVLENIPSDKITLSLMLDDGAAQRPVKHDILVREDVSRHFHLNYDQSGFLARIPLSALKNKEHKLAIIYEHLNYKRETKTDVIVSVPRSAK